jgi:hypothetical protein
MERNPNIHRFIHPENGNCNAFQNVRKSSFVYAAQLRKQIQYFFALMFGHLYFCLLCFFSLTKFQENLPQFLAIILLSPKNPTSNVSVEYLTKQLVLSPDTSLLVNCRCWQHSWGQVLHTGPYRNDRRNKGKCPALATSRTSRTVRQLSEVLHRPRSFATAVVKRLL